MLQVESEAITTRFFALQLGAQWEKQITIALNVRKDYYNDAHILVRFNYI